MFEKTILLMHEWLSGGASPCQGEGRGFESRLVLFYCPESVYTGFWAFFVLKKQKIQTKSILTLDKFTILKYNTHIMIYNDT